MSVYIASMNMRGKWSSRPNNTIIINVTSMQRKDSKYRKDFSPMTEIDGKYKGFYCFENYWQAYKRYRELDHLNNDEKRQKYINWWKKLNSGKRKSYLTKKFLPIDSKYEDNIVRDYLKSRKEIYIPQYYDLMINTESFQKIKNMVDNGTNIVIYDFDGPRDINNNPICLEVTLDMLINKVEYEKHPFGHGYIIAAALKDFSYNDYIKN